MRPRLPDLKVRAVSLGRDSARTIFADAAGAFGWGATLGARCLQGSWSESPVREGINEKELWALGEGP